MLNKSRIEAFSDGVIAIIITVMVFDLKLESEFININEQLLGLVPKFISYIVSFLMISIMWINHHQLFHQIKHTDRKLLWLNIMLLFGMSLIPFVTNLIGSNPFLWQSSFCYGIVFMFNAIAFTVIRSHIVKVELLNDNSDKNQHLKIKRKNTFSTLIYLSAALLSMVSIYISFVLFLIVPIMYFIPQELNHKKQ